MKEKYAPSSRLHFSRAAKRTAPAMMYANTKTRTGRTGTRLGWDGGERERASSCITWGE